MLINDQKNCEFFISEDGSSLCELLHPHKDNLKLPYSLAYAIIKPGEISQRHKLAVPEVYYIIEGDGIMHVAHEAEQVHSGQAIYIPADTEQHLENAGSNNLCFLCIVAPPYHPDYNEALE